MWLPMIYVQEIVAARAELETLNTGLEDRVKERTEDLIQANQEIQRFAYVVTHDLRAGDRGIPRGIGNSEHRTRRPRQGAHRGSHSGQSGNSAFRLCGYP